MKLKILFSLLKQVIAVLFKHRILILFLALNICFTEEQENQSADFIFSSMIPIEISHTSFGFRLLENNQKTNTYLNYHSWITDNLFIDGFVSPTTNNTVQVTYGMNLGYSLSFNANHFKRINYTIGYYSKKFAEDKQKWSSISIIPTIRIKKSWILFSVNYSFDGDEGDRVNKNSLIIDYLRPVTNTIIFRSGIQVLDNDDIDTNLFVGLSYKL